jgi:hypothetical protein
VENVVRRNAEENEIGDNWRQLNRNLKTNLNSLVMQKAWDCNLDDKSDFIEENSGEE